MNYLDQGLLLYVVGTPLISLMLFGVMKLIQREDRRNNAQRMDRIRHGRGQW